MRQPTRWDDQVVATTVMQAFARLAEQKVLALPDGSAARSMRAPPAGRSWCAIPAAASPSSPIRHPARRDGRATRPLPRALNSGLSLGGLNSAATASVSATPQAEADAHSPAPPAPAAVHASPEDVAPAAVPVREPRASGARRNRPIEAPGQSPRAEPAAPAAPEEDAAPAAASPAASLPPQESTRTPLTKEEVAGILRSLPKTVAGSS